MKTQKITMLSNITYILEEKGGCVYFQILQMDERFRAQSLDEGAPTYAADNGMIISSVVRPELGNDVVYLRGNEKDSDTESVSLKPTYDPKEYIQKAHRALREWNGRWEGFQSEKEITVFASQVSKGNSILPLPSLTKEEETFVWTPEELVELLTEFQKSKSDDPVEFLISQGYKSLSRKKDHE